MRRLLVCWLLPALFLLCAVAPAQTPAPVESGNVVWTARLRDTNLRAGESTQIIVEAKIKDGWHAFGPQKLGDWVSITTVVDPLGNVEGQGEPVFPEGDLGIVPGFEKEGVFYEKAMAYAIPVKVKADAKGEAKAIFSIKAQTCDATSCDRPRTAVFEIPFTVEAGEARPDKLTAVTDLPEQPEGYVKPDPNKPKGEPGKPGEGVDNATLQQVNQAKQQGVLAFIALAFGAGLLALLTPCVWPMIPITVSYFSKKTEEGRKANLTHALAYCLGMMVTFVGLGLLFSVIFGAAKIQTVAASPIANIFLGVLFLVLALNLFGVFEIIVPSGTINKIQAGTKKGGLIAPILLGFVFSLTTFTCTVPFVGTILVSATGGDLFYPIVGMLAFSFAFALPFFVLAMLPQGLAKLPKSGAWLNAVKAYMGFLEIAAATKFFSNIDVVVNNPAWVPAEAFAGIWAAIFVAAALYLFGWLRTPSDDGKVVGLGRKVFGVFNVLIAGWLLSSVQFPTTIGPLLGLFPPPKANHSGFMWIESYEDALAKAQRENKPLFINFTGKTCPNCRVMENQRFPMPGYKAELEKMVLAELFTDRDTPEDNANAELREKLTKSATNPAYAILKPDGTVVGQYQGLAITDKEFIEFLKAGIAKANE